MKPKYIILGSLHTEFIDDVEVQVETAPNGSLLEFEKIEEAIEFAEESNIPNYQIYQQINIPLKG